jgi:predicted DNA-binding transcriptional regulator AlpA
MDSDKLLTITEVSALLGVRPSWIYGRTSPAINKGDCPPFLKLGRLLRFRRSEVLAWLEGHHSGVKPSSL